MSRPRNAAASKLLEPRVRQENGSRRQNSPLLSVIAYARDEAKLANEELVAFCLDIALAAAKGESSMNSASIDALRPLLQQLETAQRPLDLVAAIATDQVH